MMLYLHIPFCVQKCLYCDFCSYPCQRQEEIAAYVPLLIREMDFYPSQEPLTSVFLGGGTPSLLPPKALKSLFAAIRERYTLAPGCEISLEANPGTLTPAFLDAALEAGVGRLSLGVQALQDPLLRVLGRIHSAEQARESVRAAKRAGFANISIDLMYALPGQRAEDLLESVDFALSEGLPHVSLYALTIEPNTPFGRMRAAGKLPLPDEEAELDMQAAAIRRLAEGGLRRYEVSNFALPGRECRHNLGYWTRLPYIGLGVSAHGFLSGIRYANTCDLRAYAAALDEGNAPKASEQAITPDEADFEALMLGLRLTEGVELPAAYLARLERRMGPLLTAGFLQREGRRLRLTDKGFPVMNAVLTRLMD